MHRKIKITIMTVLLTMILSACGQDAASSLEQVPLEEDAFEETQAEENREKSSSIYVYVCGAVLQEGVYELPAGSRVYEAIEMAGGFREDAAATQMNQAEVLEDETRIYVPTLEEAAKQQTLEDGKVNLNTATKEELMTLTGVGEAKAESIIQYREESGAFQSIEDIMQISGIKEGLFNKIKDYITV